MIKRIAHLKIISKIQLLYVFIVLCVKFIRLLLNLFIYKILNNAIFIITIVFISFKQLNKRQRIFTEHESVSKILNLLNLKKSEITISLMSMLHKAVSSIMCRRAFQNKLHTKSHGIFKQKTYWTRIAMDWAQESFFRSIQVI